MKKKLPLILSAILICIVILGCEQPNSSDCSTQNNKMSNLIISRVYIAGKGQNKFFTISNMTDKTIDLSEYRVVFTPAIADGRILELPQAKLAAGTSLFCINGFGTDSNFSNLFPTIANSATVTKDTTIISKNSKWTGIKGHYTTETISIGHINNNKIEIVDTAPKLTKPCAYLRSVSPNGTDNGWYSSKWNDPKTIEAIDTGKGTGKTNILPIKPAPDINLSDDDNQNDSHITLPGQTKKAENKALGLPIYNLTEDKDNYIVEKNEFIIGYNNTTHNPNWVTWHYTKADGRSTRNFKPEELLPDTWIKVQDEDYDTPSMQDNYNRGHMCPNGDRNAMSNETYTTANIIPQDIVVNANQWADYEKWMRNETTNGYEYYSIAGPSIESDGSFTGIASGLEIQIPSYVWRIGLIIDEKEGDDLSRINNNETKYLKAIAVWMPNDRNKVTSNWKDYIVTIREVEEKTGLDFFSELNDSIENKLENYIYTF